MMRELVVSPLLGLKVAGTVAFVCGVHRYWPDADAWRIQYVTPLLLAGTATLLGIPTVGHVIKYHIQVRRKRLSKKPKPSVSDGGWATEEELEAAGCFDPNNGVPVGKLNGRPIFAQPTHWLVNAPAGTGKSISAVIPVLCHGYRIPGKNKDA